MAFLGETFDTSTLPVPENSGFEPLPEGWYTATIGGAELHTTKNGSGQYIAVKYAITGPSHQGRVVFANLNIRNPSSVAERIGREQLGQLMRAIGLAKVQDTDELIGGQVAIKLKIRKQDGYEPSNDVTGFKAIEGSTPPAPVSAGAEAKPRSASAPPWQK